LLACHQARIRPKRTIEEEEEESNYKIRYLEIKLKEKKETAGR
jgi:hypothetical protein